MKTLDQKVGEVGEWLGSGTLNVFGMPFAGKDTHGGRLARHLGVELLGGGAILRNSAIPAHVRASMERGELIPSGDYRRIVVPYLSQAAFAGKPLVLSAVGRVKGEEQGVLAATEEAGHPTIAVPYLDIPEAEALRRWREQPSRDRADDSPASVGLRFEEFRVKTAPVIAEYERKGLLVPVSGMQAEELTFAALVGELHRRATLSQAIR